MPNSLPAAGPVERIVWLSGSLLTFLNKILLPGIWLWALGWLVLPILIERGQLTIRHGFEFVAGFAVLATVFILWMSFKLHYVGWSGRNLVVAGFWQQALIPFEDVEAVESVWWYKSRMVRVRFRRPTPFGSTLYYLPKWAPIRFLLSSPEEELRRILGTDGS